MFNEIDTSKLSRDYSKRPWKNGEEPVKEDFEYLYLELNLPAKIICKYMGIKSGCFNRTLRNLGIYKSRELIKESRERCNMETFGSPSPFGNKDVRKSRAETMIARYGDVDANKEHIKNREDINEQFWRQHFIRNNLFLLRDCCDYHGITQASANKYKRAFNIIEPVQPIYVLEMEIASYLSQFGKCRTHDKRAIYPLELDVYFPDKMVGFEHDGLLFHGCYDFREHVYVPQNKTKQSHKMDLCEQKGIRLFQIFEDEWKSVIKKSIWKSIIKDYFGENKIIKNNLLKYSEISYEVFLSFVDMNSLTPERAVGDKFLGGFYRGELIFACSLLNINSQEKIMDFYPEKTCWLSPLFVVKRDYTIKDLPKVANTAIKNIYSSNNHILLAYFMDRRTYNPNNDDRQKIYTITNVSEPNKYYFRKSGDKRIPEDWTCSSEYLSEVLKVYDKKLTAESNLKKNRYYEIYDSGLYVRKMDPEVLKELLEKGENDE